MPNNDDRHSASKGWISKLIDPFMGPCWNVKYMLVLAQILTNNN